MLQRGEFLVATIHAKDTGGGNIDFVIITKHPERRFVYTGGLFGIYVS